MGFKTALLFALVGFFFLPAFLIFVIFTPTGWSVTALASLVLLFYFIYKIYKMK
jgi:hypothetical protein